MAKNFQCIDHYVSRVIFTTVAKLAYIEEQHKRVTLFIYLSYDEISISNAVFTIPEARTLKGLCSFSKFSPNFCSNRFLFIKFIAGHLLSLVSKYAISCSSLVN